MKNKKNTAVKALVTGARRTAWENEVLPAMRDGKPFRAQTFADRRKVADRRACRKASRSEW